MRFVLKYNHIKLLHTCPFTRRVHNVWGTGFYNNLKAGRLEAAHHDVAAHHNDENSDNESDNMIIDDESDDLRTNDESRDLTLDEYTFWNTILHHFNKVEELVYTHRHNIPNYEQLCLLANEGIDDVLYITELLLTKVHLSTTQTEALSRHCFNLHLRKLVVGPKACFGVTIPGQYRHVTDMFHDYLPDLQLLEIDFKWSCDKIHHMVIF
jgi:hypothetical protein